MRIEGLILEAGDELLHGEEDDYVYIGALDDVWTIPQWLAHQNISERDCFKQFDNDLEIALI